MNKSLLIKLHLYAGLFTSFYLIVFGFSALKMNHDIKLNRNVITKNWNTQIPLNVALSNKDLAEEIRDQIGIMGWVPFWKFDRDTKNFKFAIEHIGRNYYLDANLKTGFVEIAEAPKGFLAVFDGLHFFNGNIPNAPLLLRTWKIYQWLSLFVMTISLILGLWLWLKYSYRPWQGLTFGLLFIATIVIMSTI